MQYELQPLWNNPVFDVKQTVSMYHWEDQRTQKTAAKTLRRLWDQWLNLSGETERSYLKICLPYTDSKPCQQPPAHKKRCRVHPKIAIMSLKFFVHTIKVNGVQQLNNMRVSKQWQNVSGTFYHCVVYKVIIWLWRLSIRSIIIHLLCFYVIEMPSHKP